MISSSISSFLVHSFNFMRNQAKSIFDFCPKSCKGNMFWRPGVIWVAVPGSAHKSFNFTLFPNNYLHTISFLSDINPKTSHLSWAQDIWCLEMNIVLNFLKNYMLHVRTSVQSPESRGDPSCLYSLMLEYLFPQPPRTISNPSQPSQEEKRTCTSLLPRASKINIKE